MAKKNFIAVSVIIPMYNAVNYIEKCLTSILNQTFKNFEIIVVDDCSTDNSVEIVENYLKEGGGYFEKKSKLFRFIKLKKNSGSPGIPRNKALDIARGKYIYFLDSDDFLNDDVLEKFYKVAESFSADVVDANTSLAYKEIDGKFETLLINIKKIEHTEEPILETFNIAKRLDDFIAEKYSSWIWNKFFRRDLLIKNDIKFPNMTITEDYIFFIMCLSCAKNYVRVPFIGHNYRRREGSVSNSGATLNTATLNLIEGVYTIDTFMRRQKFFIDNPKYQYLVVDAFYRKFSNLISKFTFFKASDDLGELHDFYCREVFSDDPNKNIAFTSYLFTSMNVYKILAKQQAAEISRLQQLLDTN